MDAMVYREYGGPEVLHQEQIACPTPGPMDVLVEVSVASVNRTDCAMLRAKPWIMRLLTGLSSPRKPVLGTVFAGRVLGCGSDVQGFAVGERVFGFDDTGVCSFAEQLAYPANRNILHAPAGVELDALAACTEGTHYARNFLNKVDLSAGQSALVNGATGAIGSSLVQLLRAKDIRVVGVCAAKDFSLVRKLGADQLIDYQTEDFTRDGDTFDYVFDAVGKSTFMQCRALLHPHGSYISSELGPGAQNAFYGLGSLISLGRKVRFPYPGTPKESLKLVANMLTAGTLKPVVERTYPLAELAEAFRHVETGQKVGNVLLAVNPPTQQVASPQKTMSN